jgi:hypothetical protein
MEPFESNITFLVNISLCRNGRKVTRLLVERGWNLVSLDPFTRVGQIDHGCITHRT